MANNEKEIFVKDENGQLQFYSPSGEKVRIKYIWNENRDGLVEHEKIDVVKEMNERARGMSITEQIIRLDHGDTSVLDPNRVTPEDYSCDLSGMPEHPIEVIDQVVQAKAQISAIKAYEENKAKEDAYLKKLQDDLIAKKEAYDKAAAALDQHKAAPVVEKEGEK